MFELVIVLLVAPPMKRIVDVPEVAETVVLAIVSELPPVFKPSIVTLSAPLRSISGEPRGDRARDGAGGASGRD